MAGRRRLKIPGGAPGRIRLRVERSGGLAGLTTVRTLDSNSLPAGEAAGLGRALDVAGFFSLPGRLRAAGPSADRFQYAVTVERSGRKRTVRFDEVLVPAPLRPVLARMMMKRPAGRADRG